VGRRTAPPKRDTCERSPAGGGLPRALPHHLAFNPQSALRNRVVRPPHHSGPYRLALHV